MKDPDFLAEAAKRKLDISPIQGEEQAALVDQTLATPKNVVALVKGIVGESVALQSNCVLQWNNEERNAILKGCTTDERAF